MPSLRPRSARVLQQRNPIDMGDANRQNKETMVRLCGGAAALWGSTMGSGPGDRRTFCSSCLDRATLGPDSTARCRHDLSNR